MTASAEGLVSDRDEDRAESLVQVEIFGELRDRPAKPDELINYFISQARFLLNQSGE